MPKKLLNFFIIASLFSCNLLFAGTTGKIAGNVVDKASGEPLPGANVIIEGMTLGAQTDLSGDFFILNLPPGAYTVSAIYVGYNTQQFQNVRVKVGLTTGINFELEEAILESETVVVIAERPLIQKDATATAAIVTAQEIEAVPIESFAEIALTKAGVNVGPNGTLHFRGGRSGEVAYLVDGVNATNAFDGSVSIEVSTNAIEEAAIILGSFSAEYGQAMSGVINVVTKEGGPDLEGRVSFQTGDVFTSHSEIFTDEIEDIDPFNTYETELNLSGPFPFTNNFVTFNLSGRWWKDSGYLYGERLHNPVDIADSIRTGDGAFVPLNPSENINAHGKFKFNISDRISFYLSGVYENSNWITYEHQPSKVPDGYATRYQKGYQIIGKLNHNFANNAFYTLDLAYINNDFERFLDEDPFSEKHVWGGYRVTSAGQQFYTGGTDNFRQFKTQKTINAKLNVHTQLWKAHEIVGGIEFRQHELFNHSYDVNPDVRDEPFDDANSNGIWDPGEEYYDVNRNKKWDPAEDNNNNGILGDIIEVDGWTNDKYTRKPFEFYAFIQDKIELQDMVINVGVRLDYFEPDGRTLTDPTDPDITNPIKNENNFRDYNGNGLQDPGEPDVTLEERQTYWYQKVDPTLQISPRVAFAFPISAQGKLFFSYGHFFQLPPYNFLYERYERRIKPGLIGSDLGNSDLKPQKTISYEVGVEQQILSDVAVFLKIYQKDMRNIIGQDIVVLPNTDSYALYVNRDYGRVRGVNFTLQKRFSNFFSASVDYTFQVAEGNESDPTESRRNWRLKLEELKKIVPLAWDQTHTLRLNGIVAKPKDWSISLLGRIETGYPYTPQAANEIIQIAEANSGRKISIIKFDLTARKTFPLHFGNSTMYFSIYTKIYNLFDRMNENLVWDATGRATYGLGIYGAAFDPEWQRRPHWFYKPREIFLGVEFLF